MATDTQLDLRTVLPEALDEQDACVRILTDGLQAREGVINAHVKRPDGAEAAQLCVHFEPGVISLGRIRELALSLAWEAQRPLISSGATGKTGAAALRITGGVPAGGPAAEGIRYTRPAPECLLSRRTGRNGPSLWPHPAASGPG